MAVYTASRFIFKVLTDDDIMPIGKHKGKALKRIPPKYMLYLLKSAKPVFYRRYIKLMMYIERNQSQYEHKIKNHGHRKQNPVDGSDLESVARVPES